MKYSLIVKMYKQYTNHNQQYNLENIVRSNLIGNKYTIIRHLYNINSNKIVSNPCIHISRFLHPLTLQHNLIQGQVLSRDGWEFEYNSFVTTTNIVTK